MAPEPEPAAEAAELSAHEAMALSAHEAMALSAHEAMAGGEPEEVSAEEERKAREELERFKIEVEIEAVIDQRSRWERELQEAGGVRAVSMLVRVPEAKNTIKRVKVSLVDGLNQVLGSVVNFFKEDQAAEEPDAALMQVVPRLVPFCHMVRHLVHYRFERHAYAHFQFFLDLFVRAKTGFLEIAGRWLKLERSERVVKPSEFTEPVDRLLQEMIGCVRKLLRLIKPQDLPHIAPIQMEADHVAALALPPREQTTPAIDASRLPQPTSAGSHEVTLGLMRSIEQQVLALPNEMTVGELKLQLVKNIGMPEALKLMYRSGAGFVELFPQTRLCTLSLPVIIDGANSFWDRQREGEVESVPTAASQAAPWLSTWIPMLKVTEQTGTQMLVELREAFAEPSFQKEYNRMRKTARAGETTHVEKALEVQQKVLPPYGFEGSLKGVQEMRNHIHHLANTDPALRKVQLDIHRLLQFGEPLPKMPIIRPAAPQRFDLADAAAWKAHLASEGFAVIAGVAASHEVQSAYGLLWDFIERSDPRGQVRRTDVATWVDGARLGEGWPAGRADGIIHTRGIGQAEALWYLRGLPKLRKAFATLWGTEDLVVSFDGAGVFRPYGHNSEWKTKKRNWYHVDQAHKKRGLHCIQGLVTLKDATPHTGGLVVVPQSHRFHGEVCRSYKEPANGWNFLGVKANDPVLTANEGPKMVQAKAGDLLLWDSRTVHCNTQPLLEDKELLHGNDLIRAVAYICMTPAAWCTEDTLSRREAGRAKGVTTSHWPHEYHPMDIPKEELNFSAASLTEAQARLVRPNQEIKRSEVVLPGSISFLPETAYTVLAERAPIRRTPTKEWDDPIGKLSRGQSVQGFAFGSWLRLGRGPWLPLEAEEAWVSMDSERDPTSPALRAISS